MNVSDGPISVLLIHSEGAIFVFDQSVGSTFPVILNFVLTFSSLLVTMAAITSSQMLTARPRVALKTTASSRAGPAKVHHKASRHINAPVKLGGECCGSGPA